MIKIALLLLYLIITVHFFLNWLKFFDRNSVLSVEDRFFSGVILCTVVILWPLIIPISCQKTLGNIKLTNKFKRDKSKKQVKTSVA